MLPPTLSGTPWEGRPMTRTTRKCQKCCQPHRTSSEPWGMTSPSPSYSLTLNIWQAWLGPKHHTLNMGHSLNKIIYRCYLYVHSSLYIFLSTIQEVVNSFTWTKKTKLKNMKLTCTEILPERSHALFSIGNNGWVIGNTLNPWCSSCILSFFFVVVRKNYYT